MNLVCFYNFSKIDNDLFFSIISKLKDRGSDIVTIPFADLCYFMPKNISRNEIIKSLERSIDKLLSSFIRIKKDQK